MVDLVESGSGMGAARISRRLLLRKMAGAGALAAAGGIVVGGSNALAQDGAFFRTTSALNLRTGPGPRRRVLLVIPESAVVSSHGQLKNGYRKVGYQGTVGWAHTDYLVDAEGETEVPVPTGTARTTDVVNFRNGASTSARVIRVLPANTEVEVFDVWENGFRMVGFAQIAGWIHADYLTDGGTEVPVPVGTARTTDVVNFRNGASTSARIIQVLPADTKVDVFDVWENGYRMVGYTQITGWIHADYLSGQSGPLGGYVTITSALNLREEPNTNARVLAVMPKGARAFRGDVIANGFLGITYNGMFGWAHMDYLVSD